MEISFGNKGIYHYIDAKAGGVLELEASGRMYQIQMLVENHLSYVLHAEILCANGELWLTHNTEQCYCLKNMLMQERINGNVLRELLRQIMECMQEIEPYLLHAADLVLRAEYMFWNPAAKRVRIICVPGYETPVCEQLRLLLESMMPWFDHTDHEGERMLYMCHQLVSDAWQGLSGLMELLQEPAGTPEARHMEQAPALKKELPKQREQALPAKPQEAPEEEVSDTILSKRVLLYALAGGAALALIVKYLFFDGTTGTAIFGVGWLLALLVLAIMTVRGKGDDSDAAMQEYACRQEQEAVCTSVEEPAQTPECEWKYNVVSVRPSCRKLVPLTNGALEPLCILPTTETVTVGRDKQTDYRVRTTQISRMHARVYNRADGLFLEDLNSTNGTFVNAKRIPALTEYKLNKGDVIGFANEEFFVS